MAFVHRVVGVLFPHKDHFEKHGADRGCQKEKHEQYKDCNEQGFPGNIHKKNPLSTEDTSILSVWSIFYNLFCTKKESFSE